MAAKNMPKPKTKPAVKKPNTAGGAATASKMALIKATMAKPKSESKAAPAKPSGTSKPATSNTQYARWRRSNYGVE